MIRVCRPERVETDAKNSSLRVARGAGQIEVAVHTGEVFVREAERLMIVTLRHERGRGETSGHTVHGGAGRAERERNS